MQRTPQQLATSAVSQSSGSGDFSLMEDVSAFVTEQLKAHRDHDDRMRREMEGKLEALRKDLTPKPPGEVVSEAQLEALQVRLESLHAAELLDDDALFALEDCIADFIDCASATVAPAESAAVVDKVSRLVGLSQGISNDAAFARQAKRKFVR